MTRNLLICNTQQAARTLPDIMAAPKARPGHVTFGSSSPASAQHRALELFKQRANDLALPMPDRDSGPLITDLIGGQVQHSFETMIAALVKAAGTKIDS